MNVIPFKAEHFWAVDVQPAQRRVYDYVTPELLAELENQNSFTCVKDDQVLMCFGWLPLHTGRASLWSFLSKNAGKHMVALTRIGKRLVDSLNFKRLEMEVDCEFEQGHRWAKILGFELEAERLRGFRMDGGDTAVYARVL